MLVDEKKKGENQRSFLYLFGAWTIAVWTTLAVLYIEEVLGQAPCNLCWFQRVFMFPLPLVLGIALWRFDLDIWRYCVPLAASGLAIALYHFFLYVEFIPSPIIPCTANGPSCTGELMLIFGIPIPGLSVGVFTVILVLLLALRKTRQ